MSDPFTEDPTFSEPEEVSDQPRNVEPSGDDVEYEIADQGTHFGKNLGHWSGWPRGTAR